MFQSLCGGANSPLSVSIVGKRPLTSFKATAVSKIVASSKEKYVGMYNSLLLDVQAHKSCHVITHQSSYIVNLPREMLQLRVGMRVARGSWDPTLETLFWSATVYGVVNCVCKKHRERKLAEKYVGMYNSLLLDVQAHKCCYVITHQSPYIVNLPREMLQLRVGMRVARGSWDPTLETLFWSATVYCVVNCVCNKTTRTRIGGWWVVEWDIPAAQWCE